MQATNDRFQSSPSNPRIQIAARLPTDSSFLPTLFFLFFVTLVRFVSTEMSVRCDYTFRRLAKDETEPWMNKITDHR